MATWLPPDISEVCANQNAPLTQCSQTGLMFLTLLTQLFGNSVDNKFSLPKNPYSSDFSPVNSGYENNIFGSRQIPLGPLDNLDFSPTPNLASFSSKISEPVSKYESKIHSFGPKGSIGVSKTTFSIRHDPFNSDFSSSVPKFENAPPVFDYNFLNRRSLHDSNTAESEKVTVKEQISFPDSDAAGSAKVTMEKKKGKSRRKRQAIEEYDFIIVGAGSAGCVIANRLSEVKKWKVLLLEAGPEEPDVTSVPAFAPTLAGSSIDWNYRTQPEELSCRAQVGQTCHWTSGKVMGGSSAINYLVYMRGNKEDYNGWADLGNYGWSYPEVLPYFKKSENNKDIEAKDTYHHGSHGLLNVERFKYADRNVLMILEAFKETGLPLVDFNGKSQLGTMTAQTTSRNGQRMSTNAAFIRPIRDKRPNLTVRTNAQVTKILIDPNEKVAYGVKYLRNGKWCEVHAKKEVVISSGALNSPKILMLSGIGPREDLEALSIPVMQDLKVGHNLHDHATTEAMLMGLTNKSSTLLSGEQILHEVEEFSKLKYSKGPLTSTGPVHVTAFIKTKYADFDSLVPDIQFHFDGRNLRDFYSDSTHYLASRIFPFSYYNGINVRPILLLPKSRGYLTLNTTDPIFAQPLIYPRLFTVKRDIDTLIAALEYITKLENTKAFKEYGVEFIRHPVDACTNNIWGTYDYFFCIITRYTGTIFHPTGTCKMGPHWDRDAVVDPRLRVYGIGHLRVADASVMPNIPRGNTNAPIIMIGEKVSDMIKEDWKDES